MKITIELDIKDRVGIAGPSYADILMAIAAAFNHQASAFKAFTPEPGDDFWVFGKDSHGIGTVKVSE